MSEELKAKLKLLFPEVDGWGSHLSSRWVGLHQSTEHEVCALKVFIERDSWDKVLTALQSLPAPAALARLQERLQQIEAIAGEMWSILDESGSKPIEDEEIKAMFAFHAKFAAYRQQHPPTITKCQSGEKLEGSNCK